MAGKLRRGAATRIGAGAEFAAPPVGGGAAAALNPGGLFAKIGARDRAQAVAYAYQHELVARHD